jgi:nicotinamidase/pyrazinamidase
MKKALVLVDLQNDFLPGGALAVPDGDAVVPVANALMKRFDLVVATQDWHPPAHASFASQHEGHEAGEVIEMDGRPQILWPDHCVRGTRGAELAAGLDRDRIADVIRKGTDKRIDSYSGFYDNAHLKDTGLGDDLKARGVEAVYVCGLALDYCVKFTALDAAGLGLKTFVVQDGCRAVNLEEGDDEKALAKMRDAGVEIVQSRDLAD